MEYKKEDYKIAAGPFSYTFPELYTRGKDGDLFECISSPIEGFRGTRIRVKTHIGVGTILVKPEATNDDSSTLITPYGALTGGKYKRLVKAPKYTEIALSIAVRRINDGKPVFIYTPWSKVYEEIDSCYKNLTTFGVDDFEDLDKARFYIKD